MLKEIEWPSLESRVLDAWHAGLSAEDISKLEDLRSKKIYRLVEVARREGDPRAVRRLKSVRAMRFGITDRAVVRVLNREARRRHLMPQSLAARILSIIVADNLIDAILDDADEIKKERIDEVRSQGM